MTPHPCTLLGDARLMANQSASLYREAKACEKRGQIASAAHCRGLAFGLRLAAKQFVHANNRLHIFNVSQPA